MSTGRWNWLQALAASRPGHLVPVVCESRSGRRRYWLLDPTADQVNAPGRGLALLPLLGEVDAAFLDGEPVGFTTQDGTHLIYRRRAGLENTAVVPAWTGDVLVPEMAKHVHAGLAAASGGRSAACSEPLPRMLTASPQPPLGVRATA